jgi:hypothetical protein
MMRPIGSGLVLLFAASVIICALMACEQSADWVGPERATFPVSPKFSQASSVLDRHKAELEADVGSDNLKICDLSQTKDGQYSIDLGVKRVTPELLAKLPLEIEGVALEVHQLP